MIAVIQRVKNASVAIDGILKTQIGRGYLILLGVDSKDTEEDSQYLVHKVANLRIFSDEEGKMNHSIQEAMGSALVVSQFTLLASTRKGNRPSFANAARAEQAKALYTKFHEDLGRETGIPVKTGVFGADMEVSLNNDGPVTILINSNDRKPEGPLLA